MEDEGGDADEPEGDELGARGEHTARQHEEHGQEEDGGGFAQPEPDNCEDEGEPIATGEFDLGTERGIEDQGHEDEAHCEGVAIGVDGGSLIQGGGGEGEHEEAPLADRQQFEGDGTARQEKKQAHDAHYDGHGDDGPIEEAPGDAGDSGLGEEHQRGVD